MKSTEAYTVVVGVLVFIAIATLLSLGLGLLVSWLILTIFHVYIKWWVCWLAIFAIRCILGVGVNSSK